MSLHLRKHLREQRGQAMVEYSTLTFAILLMIGGSAFALPMNVGPFHQKVSLAQAIYASLQTYVDSYYYSLHLLVP